FLQADPRLQPRGEIEILVRVAAAQLLRLERQRSKNVVIATVEAAEARRHHAHDLIILAVQQDGLSDDAAVAAVEATPEPIGDHDDVLVSRLIVVALQIPSSRGADAEHTKPIARDL